MTTLIKHHVKVVILLLVSYSSFAQIPNGSFENWNTIGNCMEADDWFSTNVFDSLASFCPSGRSTDHYPAGAGNYSLRLENNIAVFPAFNGIGIITTTQLDGSDKPLFPVTGHPNSLCGYYKFSSVNGDTMSINVYLSYNGSEIASGHFYAHASVANWTPFSLPISSYTLADSARITIMAANIEGAGVQGNSVLYIDNLSFDSLIIDQVQEFNAANSFQLYPNPATDWVYLDLNSTINGMIDVELLDLSGRVLRYWNLPSSEHDLNLNCSDLENGWYFVKVRAAHTPDRIRKLQVWK